jgi:hypothetical protein
VISFFREFYEYNGTGPFEPGPKKGTGMSLLELRGLFPGGLKDGARRLAGCPTPRPATDSDLKHNRAEPCDWRFNWHDLPGQRSHQLSQA